MLELAIKRYFWVFNLLALALAAFFVAKGANAFVEAALLPDASAPPVLAAPRTKGPAAHPAGPSALAKSDDVINHRNLFDHEASESAPAGPESAVAGAAPTGAPAYCARPAAKASGVTLVGIAESSDPEYSLAALRVGSDVHYRRVKDPEPVGDYVLREVHTHWVCLERSGSLEYVDAFDTSAAAAPVATAAKSDFTAAPTSGTPDDSDKYIAKTGPDEWSIDAGFLNDQIKNPAKLMTMGRAVPHLVDGKPEGFKLYAIRPSGLYYKLGVRNGDVIKSVNGSPLNSIDQALGLFNTLMESRDITLGVERRGSVVNMHYVIR